MADDDDDDEVMLFCFCTLGASSAPAVGNAEGGGGSEAKYAKSSAVNPSVSLTKRFSMDDDEGNDEEADEGFELDGVTGTVMGDG